MKRYFKILLIGSSLLINGLIQAQNFEIHKAINSDIWQNFTSAFEDLDYELFKSLHTESLIRVSGDGKSIKDLNAYMLGYERRWKNKDLKQTISFRFTERIANSDKASERGVYKLTVNLNSPTETYYYGKFHVFLTKSKESWKIQIDYDSSEHQTINEASYNAAFAIDDFEKY